MSIILYNNGGSGNHGCEAIIRGTTYRLNKNNFNDVILMSLNVEEELKYDLDKAVIIKSAKTEIKKNIEFVFGWFMNKFFKKYIYLDILPFKKNIKQFKSNDIAFAIGGDTYCYGYSDINSYMHDLYVKNKMKTILWGCSIEPTVLNDRKIIKDLKKYNAIVARESITYNALKEKNFNEVYLIPDMAFGLQKKELEGYENIDFSNSIGINVSPLILDYESENGITLTNYINLVNYILSNTNLNVVLIPHVVWEQSDDRIPLNEIYKKFKNNERVHMINDHNCMELKYIISKLKLFIGARTHATIAAYSSCVPTLVVGYSIKAKGIAKDLFGTWDNYVIPVQELKDENKLVKSLCWLLENENTIKAHLDNFIPKYCDKLSLADEFLIKLK